MSVNILPPGATIGILGGGQLGRMTAQAAQRLGYRAHIFCPEQDAPASQVTDRTTLGAYDDLRALEYFASQVDVVTYEFENIPYEPVAKLAERAVVHPSPKVLRICQDRIREKDFVGRLGVPVTRWRPAADFSNLSAAAHELGLPSVLKTARMGYDGKGQVILSSHDELGAAWRSLEGRTCILEQFVDFAFECSVIVARSADGVARCYPTVENRHAHHILAETHAPARLTAAQARSAEDSALRIAEALDLVGVLCVEMFAGRDGTMLVNELAPRPHNSGHWTMDACATSQFEQLVRAICGLPLGSIEMTGDAVMRNLIGDEVHAWPDLVADPGARVHLYGKTEVRPGRKMGHVTWVFPHKA